MGGDHVAKSRSSLSSPQPLRQRLIGFVHRVLLVHFDCSGLKHHSRFIFPIDIGNKHASCRHFWASLPCLDKPAQTSNKCVVSKSEKQVSPLEERITQRHQWPSTEGRSWHELVWPMKCCCLSEPSRGAWAYVKDSCVMYITCRYEKNLYMCIYICITRRHTKTFKQNIDNVDVYK